MKKIVAMLIAVAVIIVAMAVVFSCVERQKSGETLKDGADSKKAEETTLPDETTAPDETTTAPPETTAPDEPTTAPPETTTPDETTAETTNAPKTAAEEELAAMLAEVERHSDIKIGEVTTADTDKTGGIKYEDGYVYVYGVSAQMLDGQGELEFRETLGIAIKECLPEDIKSEGNAELIAAKAFESIKQTEDWKHAQEFKIEILF